MVKVKLSVLFCFLAFLPVLSFAQDIDRLKSCFLKGDYRCAINEGERALAKNIDKQHSDELYYYLGLSYLKEGNYLRSSDIFTIIINEFKDSRFKDEAELGLGDTYFLQGNLDGAEKTYQELLKDNPHTKLKAQAYSRLSRLKFRNGDTASGKEYADKLSSEFPSSPEAIKANIDYPQAANSAVVFYSVQVGSFSSGVNANNLCSILAKKGYDAFVEEGSSRDNGKIFRVKVGKFNARKEAETINDKLVQEGYPTRIIP